MELRIWKNNQFSTWQPNIWDFIALLVVFSIIVALTWTAKQMAIPYHTGEQIPITLSAGALPYYALRTTLRMFLALCISLTFTFSVGYLAAKNKHAERIVIPIIDILQSIPVLAFQTITIIPFLMLFPNSLLGPECAAIFAIFTGQVWNMTLGFYQSLKLLPYDLREVSSMFQLSNWQRFWRVEVPFAMPSLIWNTMMSMSGGWFFIIVTEAITVNNQKILLPGIGSYISVALQHTDKMAIVLAILTMLIVIFLYDQLLFRPLIAWGEKFKAEASDDEIHAHSFVIDFFRRTRFFNFIGEQITTLFDSFVNINTRKTHKIKPETSLRSARATNIFIGLWYGSVALISLSLLVFLLQFIFKSIPAHEVLRVIILGSYTATRIVVLIIICSLIWVPIGVWIGLRPKIAHAAQPIAQFLASFPANLVYPVIFIAIIRWHLNVNIWCAPLIILGTQWYILFNVIAGANALPKDLIYVANTLNVKGWLWWKRFVLPGIFPYFITGAITAAGGAWNASIVAEIVSWGQTKLVAEGIGAYFTRYSMAGDFPRVALAIGVICLFVLIFNRLIWQPLYNLAEKRFQL